MSKRQKAGEIVPAHIHISGQDISGKQTHELVPAHIGISGQDISGKQTHIAFKSHDVIFHHDVDVRKVTWDEIVLVEVEPDLNRKPPRSAEFFAVLLIKAEMREAVLGCRAEQFVRNVERFGRRRAEILYVWDVIVSLAPLTWSWAKRLGYLGLLADLYRRVRGS
jgi:hypothetical protein